MSIVEFGNDDIFDLGMSILIEEALTTDNIMLIEAPDVVGMIGDLVTKINELVIKVIDKIAAFCKDMLFKINIKIEGMKLNKKLAEVKELLMKKRLKANKDMTFMDMQKYRGYYTKFINTYLLEIKRGLNKDWSSVKEYGKWRDDMDKKLDEFNYKLTKEELWVLKAGVNDMVKLTETEIRNREKNVKMVQNTGSSYLKSLEKEYSVSARNFSMVDNINHEKFKLFKEKHSHVGSLIGNIARIIKGVVKFMLKHPLITLIGLLTFLL